MVYEHLMGMLSCFRYEGLSDKFMSSPVPKLLLLAGTDRLDRFILRDSLRTTVLKDLIDC